MLDILITRLKEEIAIDGTSGSSIDSVWGYVESISKDMAVHAGASIAPLIDNKYKSFVWNYIKVEKDLEFYENIAVQDTPSEHIIAGVEDVAAAETQQQEKASAPTPLKETVEPEAHVERKRKHAPSKRASAAKKIKVKPAQKKIKTKPKKRLIKPDSDDDFEGGDSSSSSSESEFDDYASDEENDDEDNIDEDMEDDEDLIIQTTVKKAAKATNKKVTEKKAVKTNLSRLNDQDILLLSYEQAVEKYGERLYITGTLELQERQLYFGAPPGVDLSPNLMVIFQEISRTRSKGLYQAEITKILNLDPRSTGHYCKSLEEKGVISRQGVAIRGMRTNLCLHIRYSTKDQQLEVDEDQNDIPYNVNAKGIAFSQAALRDSIFDLLKEAFNKSMLSEDILRALGFDFSRLSVRKWYNRSIDELAAKGYVGKSDVKVNNKGKIRRLIHLLKLPAKADEVDNPTSEKLEYPIRIKSNKKGIPILHLLVDASLESQCLQVLKAADTDGCTQKELMFALNTDEHRIIYKILDSMSELKDEDLQRFGTMRIMEFEGKQRRYRYYTYQAFKKVHEGIDVPIPPVPEQDMDESKLCDIDYFIDTPHTQKEFIRYMTRGPNKSTLSKNKQTKKAANGAGVTGRPRKNPLPPANSAPLISTSLTQEDVNTADIPPGKSILDALNGSNEPVKKKRKYTKRKNPDAAAETSSSVPTTEARPSTRSQTNTTPTTGSSLSDPMVIDDNIAEPVSTASTGFAVPSSSITTVPTSSTATAPTEPTTIESAAMESTPIESVPITTSTASEPPEMASVESAATPTAKITPAPAKITAITPVKEKGTKKCTPPPAGSMRKRTIGDYFAKVPRHSKDPSYKSGVLDTSDKDSSENFAAIDTPPLTKKAQTTVSAEDVTMSDVDSSAEQPEKITTVLQVPSATNSTEVQEFGSVNSIDEESTASSNAFTTEAPSTATDTIAPTTESQASVSVVEQSNTTTAPPVASETTAPPIEASLSVVTQSGPPKRNVTLKKAWTQKKVKTQVNIYMEVRMRMLLAILEGQRIWDIGKDLKDEYLKKATELSGPPKYTICNKTLWRSAQELAQRGEAQVDVVKCPLLNGRSIKRKLLIHKDVKMDGEEYKSYVTYLREKRAIQVYYTAPTKFDRSTAPVERLEERLTRMRNEMQELSQSGKVREAILLENRIMELSNNAFKFKATGGKRYVSSWVIAALQFGWVPAKMFRVKMLHMFMFGLLIQNDPVDGVDKKNFKITTNAVISNMTLKFFCQVIGVFNPSASVVDFLSDPENLKLTYQQIPEEISSQLYSDNNKFRRRLRNLFFFLEYLDLAVADYGTYDNGRNTGKFSNLGNSYKLLRSAAVIDRKKIGEPVWREFDFDNITEVTLYWSELQFLSTKLSEISLEEERPPASTNPIALDCYTTLHSVRAWSSQSMILRRQRKILNSYVDKVNGTVPLDNVSLIQSIAEDLDMTIQAVRAYYQKVLDAIAKKQKSKEVKKMERHLHPLRRARRKMFTLDGPRVINLSSTRAFRRPQKKSYALVNPPIPAEDEAVIDEDIKHDVERRARGEGLFMDEVDNVPVINSSTQSLRLTRIKRSLWTEHEDDLLIYSHVILRERTTRGKFLWAALTNQILPDRTASQFKNRLYKLLAQSANVERTETATQMWKKCYREGLANGDIQDPDPREMINFDLLGHLSYLLKRIQNDDSGHNAALPASLDYLQENFDVIPTVSENIEQYVEDRYHSATSLRQRLQALYAQTITTRKIDNDQYDIPDDYPLQEDQPAYRQTRLARNYALMSLLCPLENYDPFFAYKVLHSFPTELFDEAIKHLRNDQVIVLGKEGRRVPGVRLTLGYKFVNLMCGRLPKDIFDQAREYEKYLSNQTNKSRYIPEVISSGMMACILNLASNFKLDMTIANKRELFLRAPTMSFTSRRTDRSLTIFDVDIKKTGDNDAPLCDLSPIEPVIKDMDDDEFRAELTNFINTHPVEFEELYEEIIDVIRSKGENGVTVYGIKSELKGQFTDNSIKQALTLLESNNPAFICSVGFDSTRYVLTCYSSSWMIRTDGLQGQEREKTFTEENTEATKIIKKNLIKANIWTDTNGYTTDVILKDCKLLLIDYLIRKPGATEANLYRQFKTAFSRNDLHDLLDILVKEGVLRQLQISQQVSFASRKSIFSKNYTFKCSTGIVIEKAVQSCYWVLPNVFSAIN